MKKIKKINEQQMNKIAQELQGVDEKQAEKLDRQNYLVRIKYDHSDQPELVIRILSFGPLVEVVGSEEFRGMVIEKLKKQKNLGLK